MLILIGILLTVFVLFSSVVGGALGIAILTLNAAVVLLLVALRSFLRPEAFRIALQNFPQSVSDPRSMFAQTARTAPTGEILVSYTRYRQVYQATVMALAILGAVLIVAFVTALFQAGYPMRSLSP